MRITLRQLQIFRAIALTGSTTAAALSLPISQSAASAALAELERLLGARLFDRVGKRLLLNDNGRGLLPMSLAVLDGARNVECAFLPSHEGVSIDLRLFSSTTIGNYILPKLLASFGRVAPMTRLDVRIGNTLEAVTAVRDFSVDLGMIEGPCHAPDVIVTPWLEDELVIVASPRHALARAAKRRKLTAAQLAQAQWLLREPGSGTREAVEQVLLPHLPRIRSALTLGSSEAIKNSVLEGIGISCLSRAVVQDLITSRRLCALSNHLPRLTRRMAIIHHQKKLLSDSLRKFVAHCKKTGGGAPY